MIEKNPEKRIKISEIAKHPWVVEDYPNFLSELFFNFNFIFFREYMDENKICIGD